jgi:TRAP-type C4-dicarboxylate transport system permease small subunit
VGGGVLRTLAKAHDALTHWSFVAATVLLGVIFSTYCLEVVLRYLLNSPTSWSGELISYAQCASVFLVMPILTKVGGHVAITVIIDRLPARLTATVSWFLHFISAVVCLMVAWFGLDENLRQYIDDVRLMRVHAVPQWWVSTFITYGFLMSAIHYLRQLDFRSFSAKYTATSTIG